MCGRFNLRTNAKQLSDMFQAIIGQEPHLRFNIAPTQNTFVCRLSNSGMRELLPLRWGLIPSWAKDLKIGASLINARAETISEKPSFRTAFKRRRCLVPASGFYEWIREGKSKHPFHIHHTDDTPFAMAGIWDSWHQNEQLIESFSIITTEANRLMAPIHNRMPVILEPNLFGEWLNPKAEPEFLQSLIQPHEWTGFETVAVSSVVNNARNETPDCLLSAGS
ncbi:SOS response-associated peptidase [Planctomicrobium sp. SH527]|uniref:SOS response-associated peptidase n=1 Tax=Planctomicrobium sp. SH527 TaxID=3448123 RepID=UPI003F5AF46B